MNDSVIDPIIDPVIDLGANAPKPAYAAPMGAYLFHIRPVIE